MSNLMRTGLVAASIAAVLAGCGGGGGSGPTIGAQKASLSLGVSDAPVDTAEVVSIVFTGIELKPAGGQAFTITLPAPVRVANLLQLTGGASQKILDGQQIDPGPYEWMRLIIDARQNVNDSSYVQLSSGQKYPLWVPSGSESGLKLIQGFTAAAGGKVDFTVDFDLRKSIVAPPGQDPNWLLKPVLRLVDNLKVGTLQGTVATAKATAANCAPYVYVYAGSGVTPTDINTKRTSGTNPLLSVPVTLDNASATWKYKIAFIEAASYTVSFTCDGKKDLPESDETLAFSGTQNVAVTAGQTATANFN